MVGRDFAQYRIEAQIGQGGIGAVYRARDSKLGREVALKLLRVDVVAPAQRPRFEREAKALATLSHPNVVTILDCGVSDDVPYLAMELLEGQTLADALGSPEPFPAARIQRVMRELTAALAYVHERGLVHRDLKPGNVFLQRMSGGGERVKLLDFGLAKFLEGELDAEAHTLTRTGEVFGTPAYMPPEQWSGDRVDARADVYSAAVVCFEMLAGRRPFRGEGQDLLRAQLIETPPLLHEACAERVASPELERVLHHALAKLPRERLPSAVELSAELDALPDPWFFEGKEATDARRSAAAATRGEVHLATAPTLVQPAAAAGTALHASKRRRRPSFIMRLLRQVALLGAWTLSIASLVVIGVAATMIYLSRDASNPEAREALKQAMPPLRDAVTNAKTVVSNAVADAAKQVAGALPAQEEGATSVEAKPAEAKREPARNPWRKPTPRALRTLRTKIDAGQRGTDRMLADLRRYNREQPEDPRGHLLLARAFMNRNAWNEALTQYKLAFDRDESSRGDPRMLKDLVRAVTRESTSERASELIPVIYGPEALEEITLARSQTRASDERLRLERLARSVTP